ncbi:hypothetical protein NKH77_29020 [Streptomyces sp. M19]
MNTQTGTAPDAPRAPTRTRPRSPESPNDPRGPPSPRARRRPGRAVSANGDGTPPARRGGPPGPGRTACRRAAHRGGGVDLGAPVARGR